jgi:putative nucleotidyltransferase with HDIG domain
MELDQAVERLVEVVQKVAEGEYGDDIMKLTRDEVPEPVRTVAEAMGLMMVKVEAREFRLERLLDDLRELNRRIKQNTIGVLSSLSQALHERDQYTQGHASRVSEYAERTARELGLNDEEVESIRLGGLLHDIGKIGFPDELFDNHGKKLPKHLIKEVTRHPAIGYRIIKDLDFLGPAIDYVHYHHERIDGRGYPKGLKNGDIPIGAQIVAAADVFDAVTTDRPYQKGMSLDEALTILRKQAGIKLDEKVIQAFTRAVGEPNPADQAADQT